MKNNNINKTGKKVRIPRKMKKERYWKKYVSNLKFSGHFESTPKLERYYYYLDTEQSMKRYNMTPEQLYKSFGFMLMDHIVWWNWVRWKHFGIEPQKITDVEILDDYSEYFERLMKYNNIKIL